MTARPAFHDGIRSRGGIVRATRTTATQAAAGVALAFAPYLAGWLWLESKSYYSPLAAFFGNATIIATTVVLALAFHGVIAAYMVWTKRKVLATSLILTYPVIMLLAVAIAYLAEPGGSYAS